MAGTPEVGGGDPSSLRAIRWTPQHGRTPSDPLTANVHRLPTISEEILKNSRPGESVRPAARPLQARGHKPAGPRRLLRGDPAELQDPAVGAGPVALEDPAPLLHRRDRGGRPRRPPPARRVPGGRLAGGRPQAPDARLPRQPARL